MCITLSTGEAWPTCSSNRCQSYMPTVRSSRAHIHFGSCNWRQCKGCRTREFEEGRSLRGNCSPGQLHASLPIHNPNNHLNRSNKFIIIYKLYLSFKLAAPSNDKKNLLKYLEASPAGISLLTSFGFSSGASGLKFKVFFQIKKY